MPTAGCAATDRRAARGAVQPGESGGPVVDSRGGVVAMIFGGARNGKAGTRCPSLVVARRAAEQRSRSSGPCIVRSPANFRHGPRATRALFHARSGHAALLLAVSVALPVRPWRPVRVVRRSRTSASRSGATGATTGTRAAIGTTARGFRSAASTTRYGEAVRFPLVGAGGCASPPRGSGSTSTGCVAPRLAAVPCAVRYAVDAHAILRPSWTQEREADVDERVAATAVYRGAHAAVAHLGRHAPRPCLASRDVAEQRAAPEAAGRRRGVRLERAVRALRELTARRAPAPARRRVHGAARLARCSSRHLPRACTRLRGRPSRPPDRGRPRCPDQGRGTACSELAPIKLGVEESPPRKLVVHVAGASTVQASTSWPTAAVSTTRSRRPAGRSRRRRSSSSTWPLRLRTASRCSFCFVEPREGGRRR